MPGGESRTVFAKLSAMGAGIIGASLAFFFVSFLAAHLFYGLGDLSRSIQSVPELIGSTLPLSVGQYLLLLLGLKTFGLLVIGIWAFGPRPALPASGHHTARGCGGRRAVLGTDPDSSAVRLELVQTPEPSHTGRTV